jgi:hypothetical protein
MEGAWIEPTDNEKELVEAILGMGVEWEDSHLNCLGLFEAPQT